MKERIDKMIQHKNDPLLGNFLKFTTTGNPLKITNSQHRTQIKKGIEENKPELVIFDPLSTFHTKNENDAKEMSKLLDFFFEIIKKFQISVFLIHHYGKPSIAQREGGHLLRGHSVLGDRADIIIGMQKLPTKYKSTALPLNHDCYAEIQYVLRNDANPGNLIVERNPKNLLYEVSNVYGQIGKKISPEMVHTIIKENEGKMRQAELMKQLPEKVSKPTVLQAINEAVEKDYIEKEPLPGRGNPVLLKEKKKEPIHESLGL